MRRKLAALLAAPLLLAVACGGNGNDDNAGGDTGGNGGEQETVQLTVGVIPIVDVSPIYLGVDQGFFEEEGLEVTLESGQGGAAIVPGVVSGQYEFGFSNVTSLLLARDNDVPLVAVANGVNSTGEQGNDFGGVLAMPDSGITDAKGLEGKRVAVNTLNNIGTTTVRESVREAGGDPDSVEFVELAFPDMLPALEQGNVDAIWVVEPFLTLGTQAGAAVVASNFVDTAPNLTVALYFTSEQYAQQNPDVVERFTRAIDKSLDFANNNPDEVRRILTTYTQIDQSVLDAMILPKWPTDIDRASVQKLADLAVQDGLLKQEPDLDALLP